MNSSREYSTSSFNSDYSDYPKKYLSLTNKDIINNPNYNINNLNQPNELISFIEVTKEKLNKLNSLKNNKKYSTESLNAQNPLFDPINNNQISYLLPSIIQSIDQVNASRLILNHQKQAGMPVPVSNTILPPINRITNHILNAPILMNSLVRRQPYLNLNTNLSSAPFFPKVDLDLLSKSTKNIDCIIKEGYLFYLKPNLVSSISGFSAVNSGFKANNSNNNANSYKVFQVKVILNSAFMQVLLDDSASEIMRLNLSDIQGVKKSNSDSRCFNVFDNLNQMHRFCHIRNLIQNSCDNWVDEIIKYKSFCAVNSGFSGSPQINIPNTPPPFGIVFGNDSFGINFNQNSAAKSIFDFNKNIQSKSNIKKKKHRRIKSKAADCKNNKNNENTNTNNNQNKSENNNAKTNKNKKNNENNNNTKTDSNQNKNENINSNTNQKKNENKNNINSNTNQKKNENNNNINSNNNQNKNEDNNVNKANLNSPHNNEPKSNTNNNSNQNINSNSNSNNNNNSNSNDNKNKNIIENNNNNISINDKNKISKNIKIKTSDLNIAKQNNTSNITSNTSTTEDAIEKCFSKDPDTMIQFYNRLKNSSNLKFSNYDLSSSTYCLICCKTNYNPSDKNNLKCCSERCNINISKTLHVSLSCINKHAEMLQHKNYLPKDSYPGLPGSSDSLLLNDTEKVKANYNKFIQCFTDDVKKISFYNKNILKNKKDMVYTESFCKNCCKVEFELDSIGKRCCEERCDIQKGLIKEVSIYCIIPHFNMLKLDDYINKKKEKK